MSLFLYHSREESVASTDQYAPTDQDDHSSSEQDGNGNDDNAFSAQAQCNLGTPLVYNYDLN